MSRSQRSNDALWYVSTRFHCSASKSVNSEKNSAFAPLVTESNVMPPFFHNPATFNLP
jgi:hypothetical protein